MQILIVDDHQLFRSGLCYLLEGLNENLRFLEADSCEQAIRLAGTEAIDLVLLDLRMPGTPGLDGLALIKEQFHCSVVVVSAVDDPETIRQAITLGAGGYIPKTSSPEVMIAALRLVLSHGIYLPPDVLDGYHGEVGEASPPKVASPQQALVDQLSERQLNVLIKAAQGKPNKVIARDLHIAEGTVKAHLSACYRVLEVDNRTEAVFAIASLGLVPNSAEALTTH